jgi:hypothetical protein
MRASVDGREYWRVRASMPESLAKELAPVCSIGPELRKKYQRVYIRNGETEPITVVFSKNGPCHFLSEFGVTVGATEGSLSFKRDVRVQGYLLGT